MVDWSGSRSGVYFFDPDTPDPSNSRNHRGVQVIFERNGMVFVTLLNESVNLSSDLFAELFSLLKVNSFKGAHLSHIQ